MKYNFDDEVLLNSEDAFVHLLFYSNAFNKGASPRWPKMKPSRYWEQAEDGHVWLTSSGIVRGAELMSELQDIMLLLIDGMVEKNEQKSK